MKVICKFCEREQGDLLGHLFTVHNISSVEEYVSSIEKMDSYHQNVKDLIKRLELKEITPEQYRQFIVTIKKD